MKKTIYMLFMIALNIVAIIAFKEHVRISEMSGTNAIFMIVMGFLSWQFNMVKRGEMPMNAGASDLSDEELSRLGGVLEIISFGTIPLLLPFSFFFNDKIKVIVPAIMLCSFVIVGVLLFKIVYGKKIKARQLEQEQQRLEQEKRERGDL